MLKSDSDSDNLAAFLRGKADSGTVRNSSAGLSHPSLPLPSHQVVTVDHPEDDDEMIDLSPGESNPFRDPHRPAAITGS